MSRLTAEEGGTEKQWGDFAVSTADDQTMCEKFKHDLEKQTNKKFSTYKVLRTQETDVPDGYCGASTESRHEIYIGHNELVVLEMWTNYSLGPGYCGPNMTGHELKPVCSSSEEWTECAVSTTDDQAMCDKVKAQLESQSGEKFATYVTQLTQKQVADGHVFRHGVFVGHNKIAILTISTGLGPGKEPVLTAFLFSPLPHHEGNAS